MYAVTHLNTPLTEERFIVLLNIIIDKKFDEQLNVLEKRLDTVEKRLDTIEKRLDTIEKHTGILEEKIGILEKQSLEHSNVFTSVYEALHTLTTLIDNHHQIHKTQIQKLDKKLSQFIQTSPSRKEYDSLTFRVDYLEERVLN